jgi:hypothetical protein
VLIGSYAIDLEAVYLSKDHEQYRKWVGLSNHEDPTANSFQGAVIFVMLVLLVMLVMLVMLVWQIDSICNSILYLQGF